MTAPETITIDFETFEILPRPKYPPEPVGFSIKHPGDTKSRYYAWGHPVENNCTKAEARRVLLGAWRSRTALLFHNAKFDVDVAQTFMGCGKIDWRRVHDTLYLLFLDDPYAKSLSLKPSAERILRMKSSERNILQEWILNHVPAAKRKPSTWGAYIALAPGGLVGRYADGDVIRTEKLFQKLYPRIAKEGMAAAYDRERHLMPILLENERQGVHCDLQAMERDAPLYHAALEKADNWLRKRLGVKDLNLDADREVADALEENEIVTQWTYTKKSGQKSVAKKFMTLDLFHDKKVAAVYGYRGRMSTCLGMFLDSWLNTARESNGFIFTTWNQVRQSHTEKHNIGARTGRLSSTPNFQNIPKSWKKAAQEGYVHPKFLKVPDLPLLRQYFLPDDKRSVWGRRDWNQQELRITAHYEAGDLCRHYNEDPRFDHHQQVQDILLEAGHELVRDNVKILNFQDIYGGGAPALAGALGITVEAAKLLKAAKRALLPDFTALERDVKNRGKMGLPIRTWGGRLYYTEDPKFSEKYGREMTFEYKLLNYLVQGSAADCAKEGLIRYHEHPKAGPTTGDARFLVTVHDEKNVSMRNPKHEMAVMREVMQSVEFDVPMLSDGETGKNWGSLTKFEEPAFQSKAAAV